MATYYDEFGKEIPRDEIIKILSEQTKQALEFSRYKQDCRKRALDLASENLGKYAGNVWSDELMLELADKYYQWLISIPE